MNKWQYRIETYEWKSGHVMEQGLNELGAEGWQVITADLHSVSQHMVVLLGRHYGDRPEGEDV